MMTRKTFKTSILFFGDGLGELPGIVHLRIPNDVKPRILPARPIPFAIEKHFWKKLDGMLQTGVIVKVDELTEWVSQLAVTMKMSVE